MPSPGAVRSLWLRWKALELPWRSSRLVGQDLTGVLFWENKNNPLSANHTRRTAQYPRAIHPGDVQLAPAWIQWLRHTRPSPPSVPEQIAERDRQAGMRQLAAAADRRWAEKPSYLDQPANTGQAEAEVLKVRDRAGYGAVGRGEQDGVVGESSGVASVAGSQEEVLAGAEGEDTVKGRFKEGSGGTQAMEKPTTGKPANPWQKEQGKSSEGWQPKAWVPGGDAGKR